MSAAAPTAAPSSDQASTDKPAAREDRRLLLHYHRDGDTRAREALVERFMPLARHLAWRYRREDEPFEDLVQVASEGLVKAIDRFDPQRRTAFTSYAAPTIIGELKRYFRDFGWAVHVPRGMQERTLAVHTTVTRLSEELGRSPSPSEVGEALDLGEEQVLEALEAASAYDALSLEAPRASAEDPSGSPFVDTLGEEDERYELVELGVTIAPALRELPERERRILRMRFAEHLTQSEIAARVGVSQMHVSRLIRRSLARLAERVGEAEPA